MNDVLILSNYPYGENYDNGAYRICNKLLESNISSLFANPNDFKIILDNKETKILYQNKPIVLPKVVLNRISANINYYEKSLIKQFENLGVRCINSFNGINLASNKWDTNQLLQVNNINIPKSSLIIPSKNHEFVGKNFTFPLVLKFLNGRHGDGVYLCKNFDEYKKNIEWSANFKNSNPLMIQEYIANTEIEDIRIYVLNNQVIGQYKRKAKLNEFRTNVSQGGIVVPCDLNSNVEKIALKTAKILDLTFTGIDLLVRDGELYVCEANISPDCYDDKIVEDVTNFIKTYIDYL